MLQNYPGKIGSGQNYTWFYRFFYRSVFRLFDSCYKSETHLLLPEFFVVFKFVTTKEITYAVNQAGTPNRTYRNNFSDRKRTVKPHHWIKPSTRNERRHIRRSFGASAALNAAPAPSPRLAADWVPPTVTRRRQQSEKGGQGQSGSRVGGVDPARGHSFNFLPPLPPSPKKNVICKWRPFWNIRADCFRKLIK